MLGLVAKPIIDICVVVEDSSDEASYVPDLEAAGYELRVREPDWHQHRMLRTAAHDVHVHVFTLGSSEIDRYLAFRDWLRANDADRDLYASTKRSLAQQDWPTMQHYADAKTDIVEAILARAMGPRDFHAWHDDYDRPGYGLRLLVVQDLIAAALDERPPGTIRVIGMCAGQARDLLGVARRHHRGGDLQGRLVERDPRNVAIATQAIADAKLPNLEVVQGDAGRSDAYVGAAPADLVLACGIFGNITDEDVKTTVACLPALCAPGGSVIWTRAPRGDDILNRIQDWLGDAGFGRQRLIVGTGEIFGVGAAQNLGTSGGLPTALKLFEFYR